MTDDFMLKPTIRPRRLRAFPAMRNLIAETRVSPAQLMLPAFVRDGIEEAVEIPSLPGVFQHTVESISELAAECLKAGVGGIMLFGITNIADND